MKPRTKTAILAATIIAVVVVIFAGSWVALQNRPKPTKLRVSKSIFVDPVIAADKSAIYLDAIRGSLGTKDYDVMQSSSSDADIAVSTTNSTGYQALVSEPIGSPMALAGPQIIEPAQKPTSYIKLSTDLSGKLPLIKEKLKPSTYKPFF